MQGIPQGGDWNAVATVPAMETCLLEDEFERVRWLQTRPQDGVA
jgi:hypothetical protein